MASNKCLNRKISTIENSSTITTSYGNGCSELKFQSLGGIYPKPLCIVIAFSPVNPANTFAALPVGANNKNDLL